MTTNTFYNPTKKRVPLANINERLPRKRPNHNNGLTDEILYLFNFESQPGGTRRYQVADIDVFIHEYYQLPANQRHCYEIIVDKKPSKLYFDLEYDITANPTIDGPKLTNNFIQFVLSFMRIRSDELNYSAKDVLVLDSTSSRKFSRHLIFQTKDPFLDNQAVGKFVNLILEDIHGCLINHQCAATENVSPFENQQTSLTLDSTVFAKNLLVSLQPYLSRFEHCTCVDDDSQLRFRDIIEFVLNKNGNNGITWFCDIGVYTKNRAFRLLRSSKFDKLEYFTVAPESQWKPHTQRPDPHLSGPPTEAERQIFMASLVYFNGPIRRFIHVDDVCTTSNTKSVNPRSQQSSYVIDDLDKVRLDYPELANFMDNVAQDKNDAAGDQRMSRLYKAKHIQNDFRWEIGFLYAGSYKYCERIQRHHKNNNIYFVVDMRKGTYRQKCHDSDCQNFQGIEKPLPANTTPWLTVVNQDWDNISPRNFKNITEERLPKQKPYWLTKSNLEIPHKSRALVDIIQSYKARANEPGFLKRTILTRNYQQRNKFAEKDFFEQGPDVYAASRTIEYGGRFRMNGRLKWVTKFEKPKGTLSLNLNFQLEAVDLSQSMINVDGLDHYVGCANIKAMYLAKCHHVDDWFLSRLADDFQDQLLFLDISECPSVGITGILALCRLKSLKRLRLYNLPPFAGKEVATMIFEENVPDCLVEGVDYETAVITGLLTAGDTQNQEEVKMIDTVNNDQEHVEDRAR
ncbi:unnamed protein product [Rotaria socialis]